MRRHIPQLEKQPGAALVLSGGATKAFYFHLGVLKALANEPLSAIIGSSAGAVAGSLIALGAAIETIEGALDQREVYLPHLNRMIKSIDSGAFFRLQPGSLVKQSAHTGLEALRFAFSLPTRWRQDILAEALDRLVLSQRHVTGFFSADAIEELFSLLTPSDDFSATNIDLYVTATSLDRHQRAVFNRRYAFEDADNHFIAGVPVHKAVRASMSLPGMFEPVNIDGRYYIDGEVKQTLSVDIGIALADRIIISHTYQPLYRDDGGSVRDMGWLSIFKQALHVVLNERIAVWRDLYEEMFSDKTFIWIHPDPDDEEFFLAPEFSFRPQVQKMIIRRGEAAARKALAKTTNAGGGKE